VAPVQSTLGAGVGFVVGVAVGATPEDETYFVPSKVHDVPSEAVKVTPCVFAHELGVKVLETSLGSGVDAVTPASQEGGAGTSRTS